MVEESEQLRETYRHKKCQDHNVNVYFKVRVDDALTDSCSLELQEEDDDDVNNDTATCKSSLETSTNVPEDVTPGSFTIDDSGSDDEDELL